MTAQSSGAIPLGNDVIRMTVNHQACLDDKGGIRMLKYHRPIGRFRVADQRRQWFRPHDRWRKRGSIQPALYGACKRCKRFSPDTTIQGNR